MIKSFALIYRHKSQLIAISAILSLLFLSYSFLRLENEPMNRLSIHSESYESHVHRKIHVPHKSIALNNNNNNNNNNHDLIHQVIFNRLDEPVVVTKKQNHVRHHHNIDNDVIKKLIQQQQQQQTKIPKIQNQNQFSNDYQNIRQQQQQFGSSDEYQYQLIETELKKLERVIHIDLKGAVPKVEYFKDFFKMLKDFGATGILLEYEDVFPYTGRLKEAVNGQAYTLKDIAFIKQQIELNGLYIIPLVQTYGHLEWILKVKSFAHLRDHQEYPQVITQCLEESYTLIYDMLDQVIEQHRESRYFHIGLDEVYYKLMHPNCSQSEFGGDFTKAFWAHTIKIATHVRERLPKAKILIWDDMLHNMEESTIELYKADIIKLEIEPMIWAYMEDVKNWFQPYLYIKYGHIFEGVWAASAYKGASGELTTVTSIKHHYLNHMSWIDVILEKQRTGIVNFRGITLTGWTRYDHFLALCDLLPEAIPSLIFNLQAMQLGRITVEKKFEIGKRLGCTNDIPWSPDEIYFVQMQCQFPGHEIYEAVLPIKQIVKNAEENLDFARKYMTPINLNYNYLHKQRAHEVLQRLQGDYYALNQFKNKFYEAARAIYTNDTADEWLAVYLIPHLDNVYNMVKGIKDQIKTSDWKPRPQKIIIKKYPDYI